MKPILHNAIFENTKPIIAPTFSSFTEMLEWALMFLEYKSFTSAIANPRIGLKDDFGFRNLNGFDGSVLIGQGHKSDDKIMGYDKGYTTNPLHDELINLRDLNYDLNGCKIYGVYPSIERPDQPSIALGRLKLVEPLELRNTKFVGRKVIEYSQSVLMDNEKWENVKFHILVNPAGVSGKPDTYSGVLLHSNIQMNLTEAGRNFTQKMTSNFQQLLKIHMANFYQWFAYIKEPQSLGFKIPISLESSSDVFSLRDVSETGRRKAIVHWVNQHYRNTKFGDYSEEYRQVLIKKHLRGESKFKWRGLEINIIPAKYDLNRVNSKKKFLDA